MLSLDDRQSSGFAANPLRTGFDHQPQFLLPERRQEAAKIHRDEENAVRSLQPVNVPHGQIIPPRCRKAHDTKKRVVATRYPLCSARP